MNFHTPKIPGLLGERAPDIVHFLRNETGKYAPGHRVLRAYTGAHLAPYHLDGWEKHPPIEACHRRLSELKANAVLLEHLPAIAHELALAPDAVRPMARPPIGLAAQNGQVAKKLSHRELKEYLEGHDQSMKPLKHCIEQLDKEIYDALYLLRIKKEWVDGNIELLMAEPNAVATTVTNPQALHAALEKPTDAIRHALRSMVHVQNSLLSDEPLPINHALYPMATRMRNFCKETLVPAVAEELACLAFEVQKLPDIADEVKPSTRPKLRVVSGPGAKAQIIPLDPKLRSPTP